MEEKNLQELSILQLSEIKGGMDCGSGLGLAAGLYASGMIIAATGVGAGIGLALIGAGGFMAAGYNCKN